MKVLWVIMAVCVCVPALSAVAASDQPTIPTPSLEKQSPAAFHPLNGPPTTKERHHPTPMSDGELDSIGAAGIIEISIQVFNGSVLSLDHVLSNPGPPNVGVFKALPPSR